MSIDFDRVQPRVVVPKSPRIRAWRWGALFVIFAAAGIGVAGLLWWQAEYEQWMLWVGGFGYSVACWLFALALRLGLGHLDCSQAVAENEVRDEIEEDCHDRASRPLMAISYAQRTATAEMARVVSIDLGADSHDHAPCSELTDRAVPAPRALRIPNRPFYPSNVLGEHVRHREICSWLFADLVGEIVCGLCALPPGCVLDVRLRVTARVDPDETCQELEALLSSKARGLIVRVTPGAGSLDISELEQWHDSMVMNEAKLVVVIQLRDAISDGMEFGHSEGAAAMLVRRIGASGPSADLTSALHIHRPGRGTVDSIPRTVELASKWGRTAVDQIETIWMQGISTEAYHQLNRMLGGSVWKRDLDEMLGDCGDASPWLAVIHALENAARLALPQLIVVQHGNSIISLVCRNQK
ncbi:MFS transporter [Ralstonia sp. 25mfcol4.1]|uniref:MFS transporter n=1 Tax=Ralstonia sp. 25mfcol4.1 TaxID=1761899 RepID=UPI0011137B11|nr:MFS transporter [Ralstonia sp. 25mfcol4.1]